jgi:hypothetical protein
MFVRYRRLIFDGHEPAGVQAAPACAGRCQLRRDKHCPIKPRCRWRIGALIPYRLQVSLIENRREAGLVRQEHVATLGAVDAWLLPEFWASIDPVNAASMKVDSWDAHSISARMAFWEKANPRLKQLVNRLDPKFVRMEIHRRIPWPMQAERELTEAREHFSEWKRLNDFYNRDIEQVEREIARLNETVAKAREERSKITPGMLAAVERLARLQR